jgi:hypothetical protein
MSREPNSAAHSGEEQAVTTLLRELFAAHLRGKPSAKHSREVPSATHFGGSSSTATNSGRPPSAYKLYRITICDTLQRRTICYTFRGSSILLHTEKKHHVLHTPRGALYIYYNSGAAPSCITSEGALSTANIVEMNYAPHTRKENYFAAYCTLEIHHLLHYYELKSFETHLKVKPHITRFRGAPFCFTLREGITSFKL